jgi:hypothetical protein
MRRYGIDDTGRMIIPDAATLRRLDIAGRRDVRTLPPLPAATHVDVSGCIGLTALDLPAATHVDVSGCTGLRTLVARSLPAPPVVADLAARVAEAVCDGAMLDMSEWHCGTSHCHAGWIVTLAGEAGHRLELASDTATAAALITLASAPALGVPDFYCNIDDAMAEIRNRAKSAS